MNTVEFSVSMQRNLCICAHARTHERTHASMHASKDMRGRLTVRVRGVKYSHSMMVTEDIKCVHACVRVCERACVRACARVYVIFQ